MQLSLIYLVNPVSFYGTEGVSVDINFFIYLTIRPSYKYLCKTRIFFFAITYLVNQLIKC